jgi:hypothetical protein
LRYCPAHSVVAARDHVVAWTLAPQAWFAVTLAACLTAVSRSVFAQQNADPLAPIPQMSAAQAAAKKSTLNVDDFKSGSTTITNVMMYAGVAIGVSLALWSGYKMYKGSTDETGRESSGRALTGFVVGSCITIFTIIIGVVVNYATGNN